MFFEQKLEDAVSPVVGVILMVAVTVILAAVIGSFVLDLGNNVQANPQAGVTFDQDADATTASAQVVSMETADEVVLTADAGSLDSCDGTLDGDECTLTNVGQTGTFTGLSDGDQITVVGVLDGKEAVLQTYTYDAA